MVLAAGGGVKLRLLIVQLVPPWQLWQPAWAKSVRPLLIVACEGPLLTFGFVSGALGVRIANRTHSLSAVSAGTWVELPGGVTVTCCRFAFATGMKLGIAHGGWSMLPLSPMMRPWLGSRLLVAGGGRAQAIAAARGPGPDTLR